MYKLLPPELKKAVSKEYSVRRMGVMMALASTLLLFSAIALWPSLIMALGGVNDALLTKSVADSFPEDSEREALEAWAKEMSVTISSLAPAEVGAKPYESFEKILESKPKEVRITGLSSQNVSTTSQAVRTRGIAKDRQALLKFQDNLRATGDWNSVEFPLDALSRETDVPFELVLIPKK